MFNDCRDHFWNNNHFCMWLFGESNKDFIVIAHNMKAYDGYFIMNFILSNFLPTDRALEIVLNDSNSCYQFL